MSSAGCFAAGLGGSELGISIAARVKTINRDGTPEAM
jgi:hypothetical protein